MRRSIIRTGIGLASLLIGDPVLAAHDVDLSVALTHNGQPVLELYGSKHKPRYRLSDDWLLGVSLGVSPKDLLDPSTHRRPAGIWAPHFDVHRAVASHYVRDEGGLRWYWTTGVLAPLPPAHFYGGAEIDIRSDLLARFSLQTKAGFVVPFGERWLVGGAITFDRALNTHVSERTAPGNSRAGAYFGLEYNY